MCTTLLCTYAYPYSSTMHFSFSTGQMLCTVHSLHRKWLPSLVPRLFLEGGSEPGDEGGGYPTVLCSLALLLGTYPSLKPRLSILDFVSQLWRQNLEWRAWVRGYTYPFSFGIQHSLYSDIQWCTHIQNSSNYIYFMQFKMHLASLC